MAPPDMDDDRCMAEHVARIVADAPPLSDEQVDRLAALAGHQGRRV